MGIPNRSNYHNAASQPTDRTYIKWQATLCGSKTRMESPAAKDTSSYISKILWIIMEEWLAHKQTASADRHYC